MMTRKEKTRFTFKITMMIIIGAMSLSESAWAMGEVNYGFAFPPGFVGCTNIDRYAVYVLSLSGENPLSKVTKFENMSYDEFRLTEGYWNAKMSVCPLYFYSGQYLYCDVEFATAIAGGLTDRIGHADASTLNNLNAFAVVVFNTGTGYKFNILYCCDSLSWEADLGYGPVQAINSAQFTDDLSKSIIGVDEQWYGVPGWRDFASPKDSPTEIKIRELQSDYRKVNGVYQWGYEATLGNIESEKTFFIPRTWVTGSSYGNMTPRSVIDMIEANGGNGIPKYMSYLLGINQNSSIPADNQITTTINGFDADGMPIIGISPDKSNDENVNSCVKYTVLGTPKLGNDNWIPVTGSNKSLMRFFRVKAEIVH